MNNVFVGQLTRQPNGALNFTYEPTWANDSQSIPLSLSLPLTTKIYSGDVVINYFDNLLPDNAGIRKVLAQRMSIPTQEVYDLLSAIGRDCVGAVQLIPSGEVVAPNLSIQATPITSLEIAKVLKNLKNFPLGARADENFRISIAGAQEKTAFLKINNKWHIPHGTTPSSHIFKIQMGAIQHGIDMSQSVENEWLCLKICKAFGLPVTNAKIINFSGVKALVVERFDRAFIEDNILRYAQEDFCQVFGVPSHQKYENEGGPGIIDIMETLTKSDNPLVDKAIFMKSQILFSLLAAIDGHAKNFSVFLAPEGIRLTPLYDVMSAYPLIEKKQLRHDKIKFAMAVGNNRHYKLKEIQQRHWLQTAKKAKFSEAQTKQIIDELIENTPQVMKMLQKKLPKNFPKDIANPIFKGIHDAVTRLKE